MKDIICYGDSDNYNDNDSNGRIALTQDWWKIMRKEGGVRYNSANGKVPLRYPPVTYGTS